MSHPFTLSYGLPEPSLEPTQGRFYPSFLAEMKGSDWIRLVFAHVFPLNSRAPIASANFISDGKVQVIIFHASAEFCVFSQIVCPWENIAYQVLNCNKLARFLSIPFRAFQNLQIKNEEFLFGVSACPYLNYIVCVVRMSKMTLSLPFLEAIISNRQYFLIIILRWWNRKFGKIHFP